VTVTAEPSDFAHDGDPPVEAARPVPGELVPGELEPLGLHPVRAAMARTAAEHDTRPVRFLIKAATPVCSGFGH
jgi:hypothetical protein